MACKDAAPATRRSAIVGAKSKARASAVSIRALTPATRAEGAWTVGDPVDNSKGKLRDVECARLDVRATGGCFAKNLFH